MNNYGKLINEVKKVDRIAALRLARELPLLKARKQIEISDADSIYGVFLWENTRQGVTYWGDLSDKLDNKLPS